MKPLKVVPMRREVAAALPELMTCAQVAAWLKLHPSTIGHLIRAGRIPVLRLGIGRGRYRFVRHTLEAWLLDQQAALTAEEPAGPWLADAKRRPR